MSDRLKQTSYYNVSVVQMLTHSNINLYEVVHLLSYVFFYFTTFNGM